MKHAETSLLNEAVALVRDAGELTLRWFGSGGLEIERKHDGTPVTVADRAAERFLRDEIGKRYPHDSIIGEEEPIAPGTSDRTWIIDPIDGTKAFTHGVPLYSNLLALYDDQGPLIGVINIPALSEAVFAGRGLGCFDRNGPVRVNAHADLATACVCTSGGDAWHDDELLAMKHSGPLMRTWGDGYGFALLATGRIEAMIDPRVSLWDIAPMPVIIEEAGGRFTDARGSSGVALDPDARVSCIASNGVFHDDLVEIMTP